MDWSIATFPDGYAAEVRAGLTRDEAYAMVLERGSGWYAVEGTQMWNEPQGQVEEHNRDAKVVGYDFIRRSWKPEEPTPAGSAWARRHLAGILTEICSIASAWVDDLKAKGDTRGQSWDAAVRIEALYSAAHKTFGKDVVPYQVIRSSKVNLPKMQKLLLGLQKQLQGDNAFTDAVNDAVRRLGTTRMSYTYNRSKVAGLFHNGSIKVDGELISAMDEVRQLEAFLDYRLTGEGRRSDIDGVLVLSPDQVREAEKAKKALQDVQKAVMVARNAVKDYDKLARRLDEYMRYTP